MISFSCQKCGKQYNLKPEFAGRKTTCAGTKQPQSDATFSPASNGNVPCSKPRFLLLCPFIGSAIVLDVVKGPQVDAFVSKRQADP
jgi:hypothetical protein